MTDRATLARRAGELRGLHGAGEPLVLPNVWDAASAVAVQRAGFPVVATGSHAVAEVLGFADHQHMPPAEAFAATGRIASAVSLPVTADVEAGYGLAAGELVERLLDAGAVGCNLEDTVHPDGGLRDAEEQAAWLAQVRAAATAAGVDLVVNARTDVYVHGRGTREERLVEAVRRGRAYLAAGADCVYPILAEDPDDIATLVGELGVVNILARPSAPPVARLADLGVARVSYGPVLYGESQAHLAAMLTRVAAGETPWA